ncbi:MAG TPA: hypothetical protein VGQ70_03055 [Candidatus Udaeobacter sp.]|jgi:chromosome segregation ATPase|nr:hypothetical protein [Candidatus Udaeobacter sp.]
MKLAETIKAKVREAIDEFRKASGATESETHAANAGEITAEIKTFIQEQLAAASKELTDLKAEVESLKAEIATAKATIATMTATLSERDAKIAELSAAIADPKGKIEKLASLKAQEIAAAQGAKVLTVKLEETPGGTQTGGNATERCLARKKQETASRN